MENTTFEQLQHSKFSQFLAKVISYIFHPLFMPTLVALILFYIDRKSFVAISESTRLQWIGIIGLNTLFFPAFATFLLKQLNFIESIHLKTQKERIIPLIATMVFYFWNYQVFKRMPEFNTPFILKVFLLGCFWGIIVVFIVNIFSKISMHTAAAGGVIGIFTVLMITGQTNFLIPFLIVLLAAGIIGSARMILHEHTAREIWLGYIGGIAVQLGAYWFLLP